MDRIAVQFWIEDPGDHHVSDYAWPAGAPIPRVDDRVAFDDRAFRVHLVAWEIDPERVVVAIHLRPLA